MSADALGDAVAHLRAGGVLAYPTETVWGLGVDSTSPAAVERLRRWKGRDASAPFSILVESVEGLAALGIELDPGAQHVAKRFWPGPLTLVVRGPGPQGPAFAPGVLRADGAVGVRCSSHPLAAALARRLRAEGLGPLTSTSLNRSGAPPARTRAEAEALCGRGPADAHLLDVEGAESGGVTASTVLDVTGARPRVLRLGAIATRDLEPVLREIAAR